MTASSGTLYVVATPIGNLADLSQRAITVLKSCDLIAAEDTRHSKHLCQQFDIRTRMISLHQHNENERAEGLIEKLRSGVDIALISDAGTPLISDPGYRLVEQTRTAGIDVVPIPGPSAVIAALSVSGLPTDQFVFRGFLPATRKARCRQLEAWVECGQTQVFYESSHRIGDLINDMLETFGAERAAFMAREMTKLHEQYVRGTLLEISAGLEQGDIDRRGEFVLVLAGTSGPVAGQAETEARELLALFVDQLPDSKLAALVARRTGQPRKSCFEQLQRLKNRK